MSEGDDPRGKRRKRPAPATPEALNKAALAYLNRYATSRANLRRVLLGRVERAARGAERTARDSDREAGAEAVERILERLAEAGLLDDRAYAAGQARRYLRAGASGHYIRAKLAAKGLAPALAEQAIAALRDELPEPELSAALAFARRKRLGPYRPEPERAARRERDLAALDRRGFDLEVARKIIDAADLADLEAEIETL